MQRSRPLPDHVLVVEDNGLIAMQVAMMLEEIGIPNVQTVGSVAEALAALGENRFDCVLLDLQLGNENGLIVADYCAEKCIPIIFTTGFGDMLLPVTFASEQLLAKPYSMQDLRRAIARLST